MSVLRECRIDELALELAIRLAAVAANAKDHAPDDEPFLFGDYVAAMETCIRLVGAQTFKNALAERTAEACGAKALPVDSIRHGGPVSEEMLAPAAAAIGIAGLNPTNLWKANCPVCRTNGAMLFAKDRIQCAAGCPASVVVARLRQLENGFRHDGHPDAASAVATWLAYFAGSPAERFVS